MTVVEGQHGQRHGHGAPPREPVRGLRYLTVAGWPRALLTAALFYGIGYRDRLLLPLARRLRPRLRMAARHAHRCDGDGADRLPDGPRRLRLLALLHLRPADARGGPLRARRVQLARLLPRQHRPQGDRRPVPLHDVHLLRARRADGDDLPRRARAAGSPVRRRPDLQRPRLDACGPDDLPLHHPRLRRPGELRRPADARRAGHGVPAAERALVLAAADRRNHVPLQLPRPGRRLRRRLDGLRPALVRPAVRGTSSSRWASSGPARARS